MSKLNLEKKLKIVKEAKKLNIKKSTYLANKYDISVDTVESLVNRFEAFGIEGLINKEKKPYYPTFPTLSRENTQFSAAIFFYKKI
ncbi:hypothetical protein mmcaprivi_06790 [Mycoplasma mycoides]|nr:hypothetical protein mmcaprivi_06790 [Mycoplasma mycoides]